MSKFKDGEGVVVIEPTPFTCTALKSGNVYSVLVLGGGDVIERTNVKAGRIKEFNANPSDEMFLYMHDGETVSLFSKSRIFMTNYVTDFDVIIKELDGTTLKMLSNVEVKRG
jgi:hypothetical protein